MRNMILFKLGSATGLPFCRFQYKALNTSPWHPWSLQGKVGKLAALCMERGCAFGLGRTAEKKHLEILGLGRIVTRIVKPKGNRSNYDRNWISYTKELFQPAALLYFCMFWMLKTQDLFVEAETATGAAVESKLVATENIQSGLPSKILKSSIDILYHLQTSIIQTHDRPLRL